MRGVRWAGVAAVVLLTVVGCSRATDSDQAPAEGSAENTPTVALAKQTSEEQRLEISVPEDWEHREALTPYQLGQQPLCGSPSVDSFLPAITDPCLFVGWLPRGGASDVEEWVDSLRESGTATYDAVCDPPGETGSMQVGGQEAVVIPRKCPGEGETHVAVQFFTLNAGRGYVWVCVSDAAYEGDVDKLEADCTSWMETVRFLPR